MTTVSGEEKALERMRQIILAQAGVKSATEAAENLGVSRKTYYEWETRGLAAFIQALCDRPAGRVAAPKDPEKKALERHVKQLQKQVAQLEQKLVWKKKLQLLTTFNPFASKKK